MKQNEAVMNETGLPEHKYRYRTMSVEHFGEMQDFIQELYDKKTITDDEIVQSYIQDAAYVLPENFTDAKSLIIMAVETPPAILPVRYKGTVHDIILPPQYFASGVTRKQLDTTVKNSIVNNENSRVEKVFGMLLKQAAVRSGLGKYGRNNLVYVDGFGTYHTLHAYLTDHVFEQDHFYELSMMPECTDCRVCRSLCPTKCIGDDKFIINAGRCLSVHSERAEPFPDWITADMHNALVGCMRCQSPCPINCSLPDKTRIMDTLTEQETEAVVTGAWSNDIKQSLADKMKMFTVESADEVIPLLKKNLSVLIGT